MPVILTTVARTAGKFDGAHSLLTRSGGALRQCVLVRCQRSKSSVVTLPGSCSFSTGCFHGSFVCFASPGAGGDGLRAGPEVLRCVTVFLPGSGWWGVALSVDSAAAGAL
jgi:hypothetical protein